MFVAPGLNGSCVRSTLSLRADRAAASDCGRRRESARGRTICARRWRRPDSTGDIDRLTQHGPVGRTLAGEELAINKVLAVVGRAEARDFVDLSALTKRYGLEHLLRRAAKKNAASTETYSQKCSKDSDASLGMSSRSRTMISRSSLERLITGGGFCWNDRRIDLSTTEVTITVTISGSDSESGNGIRTGDPHLGKVW